MSPELRASTAATSRRINSRLGEGAERTDAVKLMANADASFQGSKIYGQGFVLEPTERESLVRKRASNAEVVFPYLGGEELNTAPTQDFDRYVIDFGQMTLEQAERWPDLMAIVRDKIKPEQRPTTRRHRLPGAHAKKYWWQFLHPRQPLYAAITVLRRCLVTSRVSKHLTFAFQPCLTGCSRRRQAIFAF